MRFSQVMVGFTLAALTSLGAGSALNDFIDGSRFSLTFAVSVVWGVALWSFLIGAALSKYITEKH